MKQKAFVNLINSESLCVVSYAYSLDFTKFSSLYNFILSLTAETKNE